MSDTQLPKLPDPEGYADPGYGSFSAFTADQMRAYAAEAVREALAAQGEPVGEVFTMEALGTPGKPFCHVLLNRTLPTGTKLYTATPAPAKPMTDEVIIDAIIHAKDDAPVGFMAGVRFAEAHHGITDKVGA